MNSMYEITSFILIVSVFHSTILKQGVNGNQWLAVHPNSSEYIRTSILPNSTIKYKFRGNDTGGLFTLFETEYLDDGSGQHMHTREDELYHIIDGNVQFSVDGKQFCGSTGDYVYVPRNISQAIRIQNIDKHTKPVRIQILWTPSGLEGFLDDIELLYKNDQNNSTLENDIFNKYGLISLETEIEWKELGCFPATADTQDN